MTTLNYSIVDPSKKNITVKTGLESVGEAINYIRKNFNRSISEFKIISKDVTYTKSVKGLRLLLSGLSDYDLELTKNGNMIPIYNNPSKIDECDSVILFSENKVLVGTFRRKEKFSVEGAPVWKGYVGKYGVDSWNTNIYFNDGMKMFERTEFEKSNFKLKGTEGGVGYKNTKLNLEITK